MISRNIFAPLIEQSENQNGQFVQKIQTVYKNWGNNLFAPEFIKLQTQTQNTPEIRITYHSYDSYGNSVFLSKDDATKVVHLWSYKGQYPIAEINIGSYTYDQVVNAAKAVLSVSSLDALSQQTTPNETTLRNGMLQNALPDALVTTYTYKPLIGVWTVTDPHKVVTEYVYDSFGRLQRILVDGKTEKGFEYNYKR
jgi:YD repeat-containing protein